MKLLPRYIRTFGFFRGLDIYCKVEFLKLEKLRISPYAGLFYLRPHTSDVKVFREIFLFELYRVKLPFFPSVIVDAGANIGLSSVYFAHHFPQATVYSIEPETSNYLQLQKNTLPYLNIKTTQTALWHRDTQLKISDIAEHHWAFTVKECPDDEPGSFGGLSLSTFMLRNGIEQIDLLKMDIEGAEREVFSGHYEYWLARTKMIIIELHDWLKIGCSAIFFRAISGYSIKTSVSEGMLIIELNH